MDKIILLHGKKEEILNAQKHGLFVINATIKNALNKTNIMNGIKAANYSMIFDNNIELFEELDLYLTNNEIKGIFSFTDTYGGVEKANILNNKITIKKNSDIGIKVLNNKFLTRKNLDLIGLENINYIYTDKIEEAILFMETYKKIVIKPITGQGSKDVLVIESDKNELIKYMKEHVNYIIEEFFEGQEYSIESLTLNGRTTVIGITEQIKIGHNKFGHNEYVEMSHVYPANLSDDYQEKLEDYILSFYDSLNIHCGIGHSEIKINEDGRIVLIEGHLRPASDHITDLIELSTGKNIFFEFFRGALKEEVVTFTNSEKVAIKYLIPTFSDINYVNQNLLNDKRVVKSNLHNLLPIKRRTITSSFDRPNAYIIFKESLSPLDKLNTLLREDNTPCL